MSGDSKISLENVKAHLSDDVDANREYLNQLISQLDDDESQRELKQELTLLMISQLHDVEQDTAKAEKPWCQNTKCMRARYFRDFTYTMDNGVQLTLRQANASEETELGNTVWDGSIALSKQLERIYGQSALQGKSLVELGAGCGLVGLVASVLGAKVVLTDLENMVPHLQQNVKCNKQGFETQPPIVMPLCFGNSGQIKSVREVFDGPIDYIIGADIVYKWVDFDKLVSTLVQLSSAHEAHATNPSTIIMSFEDHDYGESRRKFLTVASKEFEVRPLLDALDAEYTKERLDIVELLLKKF